jgi:ribonuclease P protein component
MLPKGARLSAHDVRMVIKNGRSIRTEGVSAKCLAGAPGMAVVVSKKVAPKATERNRLRRLVYNALPSPLPSLRVVFFVMSKDLSPSQINTLCSQLS